MKNRWSTMPERGSETIMKATRLGLDILPYQPARWIAAIAASYFHMTGTAMRQASAQYLQQLHQYSEGKTPPPSALNTSRHFREFATVSVDRLWMWRQREQDFMFESHGNHYLTNSKRGALLVGAHIGSYDALRYSVVDHPVKINVVMYRANAAKFNKLLKELNPMFDMQIVDLQPGDVSTMFELKQRLEEGQWIAILADRLPPTGNARTIQVPFLGRETHLPMGPWLLAHLLECPVYLTFGLRIGKRCYQLHIEPFAERLVLPRATREASLQQFVRQYVARLETLCLQHPFQWFNFFDFWGQEP